MSETESESEQGGRNGYWYSLLSLRSLGHVHVQSDFSPVRRNASLPHSCLVNSSIWLSFCYSTKRNSASQVLLTFCVCRCDLDLTLQIKSLHSSFFFAFTSKITGAYIFYNVTSRHLFLRPSLFKVPSYQNFLLTASLPSCMTWIDCSFNYMLEMNSVIFP